MTDDTPPDAPLSPYYDPVEYESGWPLGTKLYLFAWRITAATIYRWIPVRGFGMRAALLRWFGARIHPTARIYPGCTIYSPRMLVVDERSCIGTGVHCLNVEEVHLDADVTVSQEAFLCTAGHDVDVPSRPLTTAPIRLCRGSWVFARAIVLPGVTLGEGSVAAAGAVITRSVPPFAIVAGNPGRVIRERRYCGRETAQDPSRTPPP